MPIRTYRLLQSSTLATGDTIPLSDVADLADATVLEIPKFRANSSARRGTRAL